MKNIVIFKFDKIIIVHPIQKPETLYEACYSTLPNAQFRNNVLDEITKYRHNGDHTVLTAKENERLVKESLIRLHACELFDKILIEREQPACNYPPVRDLFKTFFRNGNGVYTSELFSYGSILRPLE